MYYQVSSSGLEENDVGLFTRFPPYDSSLTPQPPQHMNQAIEIPTNRPLSPDFGDYFIEPEAEPETVQADSVRDSQATPSSTESYDVSPTRGTSIVDVFDTTDAWVGRALGGVVLGEHCQVERASAGNECHQSVHLNVAPLPHYSPDAFTQALFVLEPLMSMMFEGSLHLHRDGCPPNRMPIQHNGDTYTPIDPRTRRWRYGVLCFCNAQLSELFVDGLEQLSHSGGWKLWMLGYRKNDVRPRPNGNASAIKRFDGSKEELLLQRLSGTRENVPFAYESDRDGAICYTSLCRR